VGGTALNGALAPTPWPDRPEELGLNFTKIEYKLIGMK